MLDRTTTPVAVREASQGSRVGGSWGRTMRRVSGEALSPAVVFATLQPLAASTATADRVIRHAAGRFRDRRAAICMGTSVDREAGGDLAVGSTAFVTVDTRYERGNDGVNRAKAQ